MPDLVTGFGLIAAVLLLSALVAGVVERAPLSFPMVFLGLGALLGNFGVLRVDPHDRALEAVAVVSLALVLFLDAVKLRLDEGRRAWVVPALLLGPGALLTIGLIGGAAHLILGLAPLEALLVGAILASTDAVVLRDVVRDTRIPRAVRRVLSVEAGTNDVVILPIVLVVVAISQGQIGGSGDWATFLVRLLLVGPAVGFAVGGAGSWLMAWVDRRLPIRREYQALYGVGLVLAAFSAGQTVGVDGFLAAFAAGFAVVVLNTELCDCFLEYGEVTAEMAMLLAFILFGAALVGLERPFDPGATLAFAVVAIALARPLALLLVLRRATMSTAARGFVAWFGPRGLNSLLLALLVVIGGVADGERLLAVVGAVVAVSVVLHGMSATPLAAWYGRRAARLDLPEERESTAGGLFEHDPDDVPRIDAAGLARRLASPDPPVVLDVRRRGDEPRPGEEIPGSVWVSAEEVAAWAAGQTTRRPVVTYCT